MTDNHIIVLRVGDETMTRLAITAAAESIRQHQQLGVADILERALRDYCDAALRVPLPCLCEGD